MSMLSYSILGMGDCFGLYSPAVKEKFNLTQSELDTIGTAPFVFNTVGFALIPGLINDRFGAPLTLAAGGIITGLGLLFWWLTLAGTIPVWKFGVVWQLTLTESLRSWGNQYPSAAVIPVNLSNFDSQPAVAMRMLAALKCISSIGGAVATEVYGGFMEPHATTFLLFLVAVVTSFNLIGAPFLKHIPDRGSDSDSRRFNPTFVLIALLIAAAIASSVLDSQLTAAGKRAFAVAVIAVWGLTALSVLRPCACWCSSGQKTSVKESLIEPAVSRGGAGDEVDEASPASKRCCTAHPEGGNENWVDDARADVARADVAGAGVAGIGVPRPERAELTLSQSIRTLDAWLYVWCTFATMGSYSVVQINVGQITESFGDGSNNSAAVTMLFVGATVGRAAAVVTVEWLRLHHYPRALSLSVMSLVMIVALIFLSTSTLIGLHTGVTLAGLSYGAYWTLIPVVASDLFGLKNLGANYKIATLGEAGGYLLLGRWLTAKIYESHITKPGSTKCYGTACFRLTFLASAGTCLSAVAAGVLLARRPLSVASVERTKRPT